MPEWLAKLNAERTPDTLFGKTWEFSAGEAALARLWTPPGEAAPKAFSYTLDRGKIASQAKKADEAAKSGEAVPEELEISPEEQALLMEAQQAGAQLDMLDLPGFTDSLPPQPGEEAISEALITELESDESEDFGTPFLDQEYGVDPGLGALAMGYLGDLFS